MQRRRESALQLGQQPLHCVAQLPRLHHDDLGHQNDHVVLHSSRLAIPQVWGAQATIPAREGETEATLHVALEDVIETDVFAVKEFQFLALWKDRMSIRFC